MRSEIRRLVELARENLQKSERMSVPVVEGSGRDRLIFRHSGQSGVDDAYSVEVSSVDVEMMVLFFPRRCTCRSANVEKKTVANFWFTGKSEEQKRNSESENATNMFRRQHTKIHFTSTCCHLFV